jgi:hypothetical protein
MSNSAAAKSKPDPKPGPKPKKLHIIVITSAKDLNDHFELTDPLQVVFDQALALVGGEANPEQFALEYGNEVLGDLSRTIGDWADQLGWEKKVELELVPAPEVI